MPDPGLYGQARHLADRAGTHASDVSAAFVTAKQFVLDNFGDNGLMAAYVAGAVILLLVAAKLVKLGFAALKYLVLPSVILATLGSLLLGLNLTVALPITVAACSLLLLFKA
jgi:hypothetical protein